MTAPTRLAGVLGWPVTHSRSPRLHGHWLREHGIDGVYVPLAVAPGDLEAAVTGLRALGFAGANVTVPHKEAILAFCNRVDANAARLGAVNTLVIDKAGRIEGRNTDGYGFLENLREANPDFDAAAGPAVVIGAGGAARAIIAALADAGAPEIRLVNRTVARAETLATEIGGPVSVVPLPEAEAALDGAALLVNSSTLGMTGHPPLDLTLDALPVSATVNDIVYDPIETSLLAASRARGNHTVDGIGMLLHQARPGFQAWFGIDPQITPALRAAVLGPQSS